MHSEILTTFIYEHALEVFGKSIPIITENGTNSTQGPTWFNADCHQAKHNFKTARNIFKRNKTDENRIAFANARTKYNKTRQKEKQSFKMKEGRRIEQIAKSQPRKFW